MITERLDPDKIDPETGLPLLPEGCIWRVTKTHTFVTRFDYTVGVYCKRRYWFGYEEHSHYWTMFKGHDNKDLVQGARDAVRFGNRRMDVLREKEKNNLSGDYPPRSAA